MVSVQQVINSYLEFLANHWKSHRKPFQNRLKTSPQAASAEAVVFAWLRTDGLNPEIAEDAGQGGVDFGCRPPGLAEFMLEVTSLDDDAVANRSEWRNIENSAGAFGFLTPKLKSVLCGKADQLKEYSSARVLAVTCSHIGARVLLGREGAVHLLVSDPRLSVPIGRPGPATMVTGLENSAFFRPAENGKIVPCRRSVSAVLLVSTWSNPIEIVGILHPDPTISLDVRSFPDTPFLRVANWPILDGIIRTAWNFEEPDSKQVHNTLIS